MHVEQNSTVQRRRDFLLAGENEKALRRRIRTGELTRPRHGVYANSGVQHTPENEWRFRLSAAVRGGGERGVVGLRSAARLHDLDGFDRSEAIDLLMPYGTRSRHGSRRSRTLTTAAILYIDGFPVTSKARTLLDLGRVCSADVLELAFESALRGTDPSRPDRFDTRVLAEASEFAQIRGPRTGASVLRAVLARRPAGARPTGSYAETVAIQQLRVAGIRSVERQADLRVLAKDGSRLHHWFADMVIDGRLVLEVNGAVAHGGAAMTARDLERNKLIAEFLPVVVVTAEQVLRRPASVGDEVRRRLASAPTRSTRAIRTSTGFDLPL